MRYTFNIDWGSALKHLYKIIKWALWDFSGFRFIYYKIVPPDEHSENYRSPSTFFLWIVGLYVAIFGVASQKYENRLDVIENRTNSLWTLIINKETRKTAFQRIPRLQRLESPRKPYFLAPLITLRSLFGQSVPQKDNIELLKTIIEDFKMELVDVNIEGINLFNTNLSGSDLSNTKLMGADLRYSKLYGVNFTGTQLHSADLQHANLSTAKGLTIYQLSKTKSLYKTVLDKNLREKIEEKYPDLLIEPNNAN